MDAVKVTGRLTFHKSEGRKTSQQHLSHLKNVLTFFKIGNKDSQMTSFIDIFKHCSTVKSQGHFL